MSISKKVCQILSMLVLLRVQDQIDRKWLKYRDLVDGKWLIVGVNLVFLIE